MDKSLIQKKFLPIGTVVLLKNSKKKIMITGYLSYGKTSKDKIWDYSGCAFPEGFASLDQVALFDHDMIRDICHMGLVDDDELKLQKRIRDFIKMSQSISQSPQLLIKAKKKRSTTSAPQIQKQTIQKKKIKNTKERGIL